MRGLSPVAASGGHSSSRSAGLSPSRPLLLRSTGSRRAGSATVAHGPSRSAACGILPDQGSNPCPLHWQADSQPLRHQGSPPWLIMAHQKPSYTLTQLISNSIAVLWVGRFVYFHFADEEDSERLSDLLKVTELMHGRRIKKM